MELEQIEGVGSMSVSELLPRARILVGNRVESVGAVSVGQGVSRGNRKLSRGDRGRSEVGQTGFRGKCFVCEGSHMARNCPDRKVKCYRCNEEGHMSYNCPSEN